MESNESKISSVAMNLNRVVQRTTSWIDDGFRSFGIWVIFSLGRRLERTTRSPGGFDSREV